MYPSKNHVTTHPDIALTFFGPMEFPIKFETFKSGWSIVYIEGSEAIISKKKKKFLSLKIDFVLANSADSDEISAFHLAGFPQALEIMENLENH